MESISNDNDLGDVVKTQRLIDATPDDKRFHFSTCDINCVVNCLNKGFVKSVNICNGSSDVVLYTCIRCYDGD